MNKKEDSFHDCPSSSSLTNEEYFDAPTVKDDIVDNDTLVNRLIKTHLAEDEEENEGDAGQSASTFEGDAGQSASTFDSFANEHLAKEGEEEDDNLAPTQSSSVASLEAEVKAKRVEEEASLSEEDLLARQERALELKKEANVLFAEQKFDEAIAKYTEALAECPLRCTADHCVLYSNRAAANIKLENYKLAISDCGAAIELDVDFTKAYYRRALCGAQHEDTLNDALTDYETVLRLQPDNVQAREAVPRMNRLIGERDERMKVKMMGQLKDLGNMFLKPFGLSTENFQMNQNAEGGYSVNMKQ